MPLRLQSSEAATSSMLCIIGMTIPVLFHGVISISFSVTSATIKTVTACLIPLFYFHL